MRYQIPAGECHIERMVVNSRFIANVAPAFSVDQAREFINRIKAQMPDASHHVPAYLIGFGSSVIAHCSDAGEPAGTAGRPALTVLQGSGLGDVCLVVTRYFGGTKLGTGGLVRAYTDAAKEVLQKLPRAEKIPTYTVLMVVPYSLFEQIRLLISAHFGKILAEDFAGDITISAMFPTQRLETFQSALKELSRGSLQAVIVETNNDTIFPLGSYPTEFKIKCV